MRLRPLRADDARALHRAFRDPSLWTWQGRQPVDEADTRRWVGEALGSGEVTFVLETPSGELAGTTRYMDIRPADSALEIGWTIVLTPYQRTPVNTEAKYLLLRRAFEEAGCARVQLKTDALNLRSRTAIERIGARFEGIHRMHKRRADGSLRDTAFFSIIEPEWSAARQRLEAMLSRSDAPR